MTLDTEKIKAAALAAIDDLDDYARMECSVEPIGPVNCLTDIINTLIPLLEETQADLAHANSILIKIEKLLEGVEYRGDYAEGVRVLVTQQSALTTELDWRCIEQYQLQEQVAQQAARIDSLFDTMQCWYDNVTSRLVWSSEFSPVRGDWVRVPADLDKAMKEKQK